MHQANIWGHFLLIEIIAYNILNACQGNREIFMDFLLPVSGLCLCGE